MFICFPFAKRHPVGANLLVHALQLLLLRKQLVALASAWATLAAGRSKRKLQTKWKLQKLQLRPLPHKKRKLQKQSAWSSLLPPWDLPWSTVPSFHRFHESCILLLGQFQPIWSNFGLVIAWNFPLIPLDELCLQVFQAIHAGWLD